GSPIADHCSESCDGSNDCSLRDALAAAGPDDTIRFATAMSIYISQTLTISDDITINGDFDNDGDPDVAINGSSSFDCLTISGNSNIIRGLILQDCSDGILLNGDSNWIYGNHIGTDPNGTGASTLLDNASDGI